MSPSISEIVPYPHRYLSDGGLKVQTLEELNRAPLTVKQVGVGVLVPMEAFMANPIPNAVVVVSLEDVAKTGGQVTLPEGAIRLALSIKVSLSVCLSACLS